MTILRRSLPPLALALCLLALWELYVRLTGVPRTILPAPSRIITAAVENAGLLWWHTQQTLA